MTSLSSARPSGQTPTPLSDDMTPDEAIAALVDGDEVHSFVNPNGMLVGVDWPRVRVVALLQSGAEIRRAGPTAQSMHHGVAVHRQDGPIWFETTHRTDEEASA